MPKFFNPKDRVNIDQYYLDMWPGYLTEIKYLNDGVFLNADTATKFISQKSVLDEVRELQKDRYSNEEITEELVPKDPN